jgi:glycosyltransferase involved in cell wall biosynthesis
MVPTGGVARSACLLELGASDGPELIMKRREGVAVAGITVVVPSFNQGHFIDHTLRSLLDQGYPKLQVIVMDGASTDDTVERLRTYGERIEWTSVKDEGQADAIANGFSRARYEWLTWLNSDDVQSSDALWEINAVLRDHAGADVVVGRGHYMDVDGANPRAYPTIRVAGDADPTREIFEKGYVAQPSVFFRKSAYDRVGGLNRSLRFCMDYELWARFAIAGCRFAECDADISGNRWHESTKTASQLFDLLSEVVATQVRLFGKVSPYFVQAVSDNLYQKLHSAHFGDLDHIAYRWLYFKSVWLWFNARSPAYCLKGLFTRSLAKSGPIVGDQLTFGDLYRGLGKVLCNKVRL